MKVDMAAFPVCKSKSHPPTGEEEAAMFDKVLEHDLRNFDQCAAYALNNLEDDDTRAMLRKSFRAEIDRMELSECAHCSLFKGLAVAMMTNEQWPVGIILVYIKYLRDLFPSIEHDRYLPACLVRDQLADQWGPADE